ncbi:hypothetical protein AG0111_0g1073 [Alternaria gaisen]|uniref:Uncharacterized protein n=1 Tax=Alternaria gaisen TaxID=167740 RepID=A0ACB6G0L6_9PLEO|nr:hypothetical protein AG0111_0g1073 [Alternaria gaisen]
MPPKARIAPGRKAAAAEEAPVARPLKRSRASRADAVEAAVEPPKKRGRPAKAKAEEIVVEDAPKPKKRGRQPNIAPTSAPEPEPEPLTEAPVVKKGRGRPKKEAVPAQEEAPVKNREGRPRKADVTANAPPATPKRGRPARTAALDLDRVAGPSRIGKRSSPRTKAKAEPNVTRRLDPRMRSKLRTRLPPANIAKSEPVTKPAPKPTARRGRPPKDVAPVPKPAAVAKPTKPVKSLAPRKMRGHTLRQIPDRYVAQVDQYLQGLVEADESSVEEEQLEEIEEQQEEDDLVVEDGQDVLVSSEQDREQYQDYSDDAGAGMDGQQDGVQDDEDNQAVVAQQDEEGAEELPEGVDNDELPEHTNGIHVVPEDGDQIEMSVQEVVEMEQDGAVNVHAEVDIEMVTHENISEDGTDFFHGAEEDGLISGTPAPPAAVIFS